MHKGVGICIGLIFRKINLFLFYFFSEGESQEFKGSFKLNNSSNINKAEEENLNKSNDLIKPNDEIENLKSKLQIELSKNMKLVEEINNLKSKLIKNRFFFRYLNNLICSKLR